MDLTAITFTELRYIVAVADTGHFGRAAERCHVSQPTLSTQVKKLEETLGVRLFERAARRVRLTAAGERIVARARVVLDEIRVIGDLARDQHEPLTGVLRLGVIPTLGPYLLPWLVPPLRRAFPRLRLALREAMTATLLDELMLHQLDAALVALPAAAPGLVAEPLFDEPFRVLAPPGHRLAKRARVREEDLRGERLLLLTEGHCLREQALALCGDGGAADSEFRATSLETLRHLVAAGMGCTLLPVLALTSLGEGRVVARPFRAPSPSRRIGIVWRRSFPGETGIRALASFIRARAPRTVSVVTAEAEARPRSPAGRQRARP